MSEVTFQNIRTKKVSTTDEGTFEKLRRLFPGRHKIISRKKLSKKAKDVVEDAAKKAKPTPNEN